VRGLPSAAIKVSRSSSTFEAPGRRRAQRARARAQSPRLFVRSIGRSSAEQDESRRSRRAASQTADGETDRDATGNQRSISHARWNRILRAAGRREPRALRRRGRRYFAGEPTLPEKNVRHLPPWIKLQSNTKNPSRQLTLICPIFTLNSHLNRNFKS